MSISRRLFVGLLGLLPGALSAGAVAVTKEKDFRTRCLEHLEPEECFHLDGTYRITQEQVDESWRRYNEMQEAHNWMCSGYAVCQPAGLYCSRCHERIGD